MKRALLVMALLLAGCQDEAAQSTDPVALTAESVGHFCQMNLLEHPGPKAQVHLDGYPGSPLFFSQVRDAVAYARMPEQTAPILAIWVNDMGASGATWDMPGATNWIDAQTAVYVVGSRREGGMGAPELVPFADEAAARAFAAENGGEPMPLSEIPDDRVFAADPAASPEPAADDGDYDARLRALGQKEGG